MTEVSAVAPVERNGQIIGAVALIGAAGEIDQYVKAEREGVFHLLIIGTVVSIVLSLVLASTISNPLNDLASRSRTRARQKLDQFIACTHSDSRPFCAS